MKLHYIAVWQFCGVFKKEKMSYIEKLLEKEQITNINISLWKLLNSRSQFFMLIDEINNSSYGIDPRDITLYYAGWWKYYYDGGKPSKKMILDPLNRSFKDKFSVKYFYDLAKKGATQLGVTWLKKKNTLYFRTLILQGGVPLKLIQKNQNKYKDFLMVLLEEQPDCLEDFMFREDITNILPKSSQNEAVYECSFEIINAILNDSEEFKDLFDEDEGLKQITESLIIKKKSLKLKIRKSRPNNYWVLDSEKFKVKLSINVPKSLSQESLSNILGLECDSNKYQLYINDQLICVFRKLNNGVYKTDWNPYSPIIWEGNEYLPKVEVIHENVSKKVSGFVGVLPSKDKPTMWEFLEDSKYKLIKGTTTSKSSALILEPIQYRDEGSFIKQNFNLHKFSEYYNLNYDNIQIKYLTGVYSISWDIATSHPNWISYASLPIIQGNLKINAYDTKNSRVENKSFDVYIKTDNHHDTWINLKSQRLLPHGCIDVKIVYNEMIMFDQVYNIGDLDLKEVNMSLFETVLNFKEKNTFQIYWYQHEFLKIKENNNSYTISIDSSLSRVPNFITGSLKIGTQKQLKFKLSTPFKGLAVVNHEGEVCSEENKLCFQNLYGYRVLNTPGVETSIRMWNTEKPSVKLIKQINTEALPLINFKDEFEKLFNLVDVMNFKNTLQLEIKEGTKKISFQLSSYDNEIKYPDAEFKHLIELKVEDSKVNLIAIPLNCDTEYIKTYKLEKNNHYYLLPDMKECKEFVVTSNFNKGPRVMPRYMCTEEFSTLSKGDRLYYYATELKDQGFSQKAWSVFSAYLTCCIDNDLPFSCFDQIKALANSSVVAAKAFLFLSMRFPDKNDFLGIIHKIESDLGFCFHWINKIEWNNEIIKLLKIYEKYFEPERIVDHLHYYFIQENIEDLCSYILTGNLPKSENILKTDIRDLRQKLGYKVLNELPIRKPRVEKLYNLPVTDCNNIMLMFYSPIAVAESVLNIQEEKNSLWGSDSMKDIIRRNIQYCKQLDGQFYKKVIFQVLKNS